MKKNLMLLVFLPAMVACERTDTRTQAANIIYNNCIESGEGEQWCRCLRADLVDTTKAFTEEIAHYTVKGRQHPWLGTAITGARLRCQCRMFPRRVEAYGLSCAGVKPIKF